MLVYIVHPIPQLFRASAPYTFHNHYNVLIGWLRASQLKCRDNTAFSLSQETPPLTLHSLVD